MIFLLKVIFKFVIILKMKEGKGEGFCYKNMPNRFEITRSKINLSNIFSYRINIDVKAYESELTCLK